MEKGDRRQESGDGKRSQETGVRRQEMEQGVRRQETGDGRRRWNKELELCFLERSLKKELIVRMKREPAKNFRDLIVWQKAH
ncbi:hypothetical protein [Okeania sp. SIO2B9]|uniref:hypothetical protein n=1 Tax=Okeania sp. SIO2B9 TaxID=2607782 RepID=UPI00257C3C24|nr:hypothetical protein [Okeania sp. SIO2B9]